MPKRERVQALIHLVEQGQFVQAIKDFYTCDASMQENMLPPRQGVKELVNHEQKMLAACHEVRTRPVSEFWVDGDQVVIRWVFVFNEKDGRKTCLDELTWQRWQEDRIIEERFYYDPAQLQKTKASSERQSETPPDRPSDALPNSIGDPAVYEVLRRYANAWTANDLKAMVDCYHDHVRFHYFGHSPLAGTHVGKSACLAVLKIVQARSKRRLQSIRDVLVGGQFGVIVALERFEAGGAPIEMERLFRYRVMEGLLVECWVYDEDQARIDQYWSKKELTKPVNHDVSDAHAATSTHYEKLLAPVYTWMQGGWDDALNAARESLLQLQVPLKGAGRRALDLGCGNGAHVVALTEMGYITKAVDSSPTLLKELQERTPASTTVCADIFGFVQEEGQRYDVMLCLGDTLTYLASIEIVEEFLNSCTVLIKEGGMFALSFRDYSSQRAPGDSAVFFVRSDAQRLLTCSISYHETSVRVTDIVHEVAGDGWTGRASHCDKLRLKPAHIAALLSGAGLTVQMGVTAGGMTSIVAQRMASHEL